MSLAKFQVSEVLMKCFHLQLICLLCALCCITDRLEGEASAEVN